jgi:hypothetical protein
MSADQFSKKSPEEILLPQDLRFPKPPFHVDELSSGPQFDAQCIDYLRAVAGWRNRVLESLRLSHGSSGKPRLSERARLALLCFLESKWSDNVRLYAATSPYNIGPFAEQALATEGDASAHVLEVLRWRAAVVDYLSDVWDVLGEPDLDIKECNAMGEFLWPVDSRTLCIFCLTQFEGVAISPDHHGCVIVGYVRAKWPPSPFGASKTPT